MTLIEQTTEYLTARGYTILGIVDLEPTRTTVRVINDGFVQSIWSIFVMHWPAIMCAALIGKE